MRGPSLLLQAAWSCIFLMLAFGILLGQVLLATTVGEDQKPTRAIPRPAPTYYLAAYADCYFYDDARVRGVSNLPPGSVLSIEATQFYQDGWREYSDDVLASVDTNGFFEARIKPRKGMHFGRGMVARVFFSPGYTHQPAHVIREVGKRGELLGGLENPQLGQVSGEIFVLETIARINSCRAPGE